MDSFSPIVRVNILMYHSISDGAGPLCIRPDAFRQQLDVLADLGYQAIPLRAYLANEDELPDRFVVLTFDDGYADFATTAMRELERHGFGATVFLPTAFIGAAGGGDPPGSEPTRRFMTWETVRDLAQSGIELGAHGVNHRDLTSLSLDAARQEIETSQFAIEDRTGQPVSSFAPPFGRSNTGIRSELARRFRCAVGTKLGAATSRSDPFDLPRIEMWYFRNPKRWRTFLQRGGGFYYLVRRLLRGARRLAVKAPAGIHRG